MDRAGAAMSGVDERLRIAEIFASVQGEGSWIGVPSTFVRVSGCNLRCTWCDTPYASWRPEGPTMTVSEIVSVVMEHGLEHVVLTGGEPMLFDAIEPLTRELREYRRKLTIETAGTVYRSIPCDLMSISPKLSNSTPGEETGWHDRHESRRLNFEVMRRLVTEYEFQLKFVVNPEEGDDVGEIDEILALMGPVDPKRVMLMAEGVDTETLHRRQEALVGICIKRGWRMTPRMHIAIFGNRRGV